MKTGVFDSQLDFSRICSYDMSIRKLKVCEFTNELMNGAVWCPIEGKGLLIEGKFVKGSRVELFRILIEFIV